MAKALLTDGLLSVFPAADACPADLCMVGKLLQISRSYVSRLETHALEQLRKGWFQESPGE